MRKQKIILKMETHPKETNASRQPQLENRITNEIDKSVTVTAYEKSFVGSINT